MLTDPEVRVALFWYRNNGGPVTMIEKVPIPVRSTDRSQVTNVYVQPGKLFSEASPAKLTQAPL